jgi:uncharacterized Zn-binding protein involved in type VI secretion
MGQPAARLGDHHSCPAVTPGTPPIPHVGGPIVSASFNVLTGKKPQSRVTDKCICVGPPDVIVRGAATVLVNKLPAGPTATGALASIGKSQPSAAMSMLHANSIPPLIKTNGLMAELTKEFGEDVAKELVKKGLEHAARTSAMNHVANRIPEYLTKETVEGIKLHAANHSIAGNLVGPAAIVADVADSVFLTAETAKAAKRGDIAATAEMGTLATGAMAVLGVGAVTGFALASAPAVVAIGAAVTVSVVGKLVWDKFAQDKTREAYTEYMTMPQAEFEQKTAKAKALAFAVSPAGYGVATAMTSAASYAINNWL